MRFRQIISQFFIKFSAQKVGIDEFGNQYFLDKKGKRKVVYKGFCEPTKIPFEWHGWLHYGSEKIPQESHRHSWQKIHLPNLTGTKNHYSPKNQSSAKSNYDFVAWDPNCKNQ